ncbi:TPA: hypothetical protein DDW35_13085 [Candidatus Sumerlaeota bacterium]|jgi:type II secretory ATPase GspE/PulE/Tfp pilus assembly ATPase PilB-like protein|nr:hypothetical protein [Candidatus Sumerlaeota bacterium]
MRRKAIYLLLVFAAVCFVFDSGIILPLSKNADVVKMYTDKKLPNGGAMDTAYKWYVTARMEAVDPFMRSWSECYLFAVLIVLALVLFWEIPVFLQKRHMFRRDPDAYKYLDDVETFGWIAYLKYLKLLKAQGGSGFSSSHDAPPEDASDVVLQSVGGLASGLKSLLTGKKQSRKKMVGDSAVRYSCPVCSKHTDDPEAYLPLLHFEKCPHCSQPIDPVFTLDSYVPALLQKFPDMSVSKRRSVDDMKASKSMSDLLSGMYALAVNYRATDIHIEREGGAGANVQMRIDGQLNSVFEVPPVHANAFLSSIKVQAHLDITNHMTPQDGRFETKVGLSEIDIRINCAPTSADGEILFIRMLDKRALKVNPEDLGFSGTKMEILQNSITRPHGLVLVTGPTGSGKTTTLYMALNYLNNGKHNIVTIEDPVEYKIPGLKQMQVHPEKNFTFATGLRSILRQDPDVIMVGEIRDEETANMAVEAATTGHLVFTTLHTMDTVQAVSRLADLGVPAKRYAQALEIIIAQRLIRIICDQCKVPMNMANTPELMRRLSVSKLPSNVTFMEGKGCVHCNRTGFYGRQAVLEIFKPDAEIREMLERGTQQNVIRDAAKKKGMFTLKEDALFKAVQGLTTLEEVSRVVV